MSLTGLAPFQLMGIQLTAEARDFALAAERLICALTDEMGDWHAQPIGAAYQQRRWTWWVARSLINGVALTDICRHCYGKGARWRGSDWRSGPVELPSWVEYDEGRDNLIAHYYCRFGCGNSWKRVFAEASDLELTSRYHRELSAETAGNVPRQTEEELFPPPIPRPPRKVPPRQTAASRVYGGRLVTKEEHARLTSGEASDGPREGGRQA